MDKNTITGLVLIGILLVGFSYLSRPSEEQIAAQKKYYDSIAVVQQQQEALKAKTEAALANENKGAAAAADSSALFFNAMHGTDSKVSIQNSVAEITFTTKGGRVYSAMLKEYKGQDKTNPVVLFDGDDATMSFNFYNKQGAIQTKDYYFEAVNKTDSSVTMRLAADNASYIDFIYTLKPNSYLMNFEIKATGMEGKLASTEYVDIDWTQRARQLEKGFTYENRLSELTYKVKGDNVDNLSAAKDDEKDLGNTAIDWVAFKNQFFSSVFIADQDFNKVSVKSRMEQQGSGYIKDYSAEMSTFFDPSGKQPTEMYFYFGPNHFKTLKALDKGRTEKWELNRLVYLGWPLIRWINQWFTINNNSTADSGSKCDHNNIFAALSCTQPHLSKCSYIGIIPYLCFHTGKFFHLSFYFFISPAKVRCILNNSFRIYRCRNSDSDSFHFIFRNLLFL